jgi:hypothetical protein
MAEPKKCFVISPIGPDDSEIRAEADWVLHKMIKPTLEPLGFRVERADEYLKLFVIPIKVITDIKEADLIVADLTGLNANVFYELCAAHAFARPVIPLMREGGVLPFDNAHMGTIFYSRDTVAKWDKAQAELKATAEAAMRPGYRPSNPITVALGLVQLHLTGDSRDQIVTQLQEKVGMLTESVSLLMQERMSAGVVPGGGWGSGTPSGVVVSGGWGKPRPSTDFVPSGWGVPRTPSPEEIANQAEIARRASGSSPSPGTTLPTGGKVDFGGKESDDESKS